MKCPECTADNLDGKNFCSSCSTLLNPQLLPVVRAQVEEYVRCNYKDQELVDVKTTEAIAERFLKWTRWFLAPATFLLAVLGLTLGIFGFRDYSDVHKAAEQAIAESNKATAKAQEATTRAQDAEARAEAAIAAIGKATGKMSSELDQAQHVAEDVAGIEKRTTGAIADAKKNVEGQLADLTKTMQTANKTISEQQSKLISTNELVTAMFSKGQVETFQASQGNTSTFVVLPLSNVPPNAPPGAAKAIVVMLLKSAPIYQTIQINFHIYVQPKSSYSVTGNQLTFSWSDPPVNLKQWPLEVSYVPDPTYQGTIYKELTLHDNGVSAK